jgi:hypothetical protein
MVDRPDGVRSKGSPDTARHAPTQAEAGVERWIAARCRRAGPGTNAASATVVQSDRMDAAAVNACLQAARRLVSRPALACGGSRAIGDAVEAGADRVEVLERRPSIRPSVSPGCRRASTTVTRTADVLGLVYDRW